jgi:renal tumor antigen
MIATSGFLNRILFDDIFDHHLNDYFSMENKRRTFSRNSAVDFNFPPRRGTGIARHLTHCSSDTIDLINQLCVYDPDHRISAAQALRHPYFDAIR